MPQSDAKFPKSNVDGTGTSLSCGRYLNHIFNLHTHRSRIQHPFNANSMLVHSFPNALGIIIISLPSRRRLMVDFPSEIPCSLADSDLFQHSKLLWSQDATLELFSFLMMELLTHFQLAKQFSWWVAGGSAL